jgi:hypothetical protein
VVKIAETTQIEEKVVLLHTMAQKKGLSSTGEVTRTKSDITEGVLTIAA